MFKAAQVGSGGAEAGSWCQGPRPHPPHCSHIKGKLMRFVGTQVNTETCWHRLRHPNLHHTGTAGCWTVLIHWQRESAHPSDRPEHNRATSGLFRYHWRRPGSTATFPTHTLSCWAPCLEFGRTQSTLSQVFFSLIAKPMFIWKQS